MKNLMAVLLLLSFVLFASAANSQKLSDCPTNVGRIRFVLQLLPSEVQSRIHDEALSIMAQMFVRIDFRITEAFVKGFFQKNVTSEQLCNVWEKVYVPEMERQSQCVQKCIDAIGLNLEKLLAILLKCRTDIECYREEAMKILEELLPCVMECLHTEKKGPKGHIVVHEMPNTEAYIKQVEEYWTKERMHRAIPMFITLDSNGKISYNDKGPEDTGYVPDEDYTKSPYKQTGKVFFVMAGRNYVCSGSSNGNNAVLTAGHCVSDGRGKFHTNWMFRPQFKNGQNPSGTWVAKKFLTFDAFHRRSNLARDVAWAIVNSNNGKTVEDAVGALGAANCKVGNTVIAAGYPVPEFGGQRMVRTSNRIGKTDSRMNPPTNSIVSKMQGGCSGGPWILQGTNNACGVNSYGYQGRDDLYSPTFDGEVMKLREQAIGEQ